MCIPAAAMTLISTGFQIAGAVSGAAGAYNQSKATKQAYEYQAAVNRNNAQIAEWQAQDAITRGQKAEQDARLKTAQLKGAQTAAMAARGVAIDEGSPLSILQDTDFMGEQDALTIRDNASKEAWGSRVQSANYSNDAAMLSSRAAAENPMRAATSSLLTSAGVVADSWYRRNLKTTG